MKQMFDVDLFNNDERIVINKIAESTPIADMSCDMVISNLAFARSISTEQGIVDMYDGLLSTLSHISAEEWDKIKDKIPFEVYYDEGSVSDFEEEDTVAV